MRVLAPLLVTAAFALGCKQPDPPPITSAWSDSFERESLGGDWHATQDSYRVSGGALSGRGAYNHPLWLRKKLPRHASIELTAWSNSPAGDIKIEAWGDGQSYDADKGAYMATGYVFIMGGWNNARSIIAKRDEHAPDVPTRTTPKVEVGRKYRWKIVRSQGRIDWYVDDGTTPFLSLEDAQPLEGQGHEYFGINNWESDTWFDDLSITPLP
ncbi:MAG: hypothetical protein HY698_01560 [Deltaproteobacteria bacterium]|nr:hypothetical protein [Deltaproteobacteria bacterium]